jgi:hypothetical protein
MHSRHRTSDGVEMAWGVVNHCFNQRSVNELKGRCDGVLGEDEVLEYFWGSAVDSEKHIYSRGTISSLLHIIVHALVYANVLTSLHCFDVRARELVRYSGGEWRGSRSRRQLDAQMRSPRDWSSISKGPWEIPTTEESTDDPFSFSSS